MEDKDMNHVLVKALPPQTDYLTYLTILEYNLHKKDLPLLHHILQEERLVTNIGWDLLHLLLPLLPESADCLQDVATLGNPREVVLKVTEELEALGSKLASKSREADSERDQADSEDEDLRAAPDGGNASFVPEDITQFHKLLQMLCILHPRIKTKNPSRFLETSVRSILLAYKHIAKSADATRAVLMFLKSLSGSTRPAPPPRNQEPQIPAVSEHSAAPDPEFQGEGEDEDEAKLQLELLQALITHVMELHLDALPDSGTLPVLAWTERYMEKRFPERQLPFRESVTKQFQGVEELKSRDVLVNQILMTASGDLKLDWNALLKTLEEFLGEDIETAASSGGCLLLLGAVAARSLLRDQQSDLKLSLFPDHDRISTTILGDPTQSLSTEVTLMTVDALIITGWLAFGVGNFASDETVQSDETFNTYLQKLSAVAATHKLPPVRAQVHFFITAVLHSHPSSSARLSFIDDTLQFCPFTNLKEAAVGWAKTELLSACSHQELQASNVFAKPETLVYLAKQIFDFDSAGASFDLFSANAPLYHAALNLCTLLCTSPTLSRRLDVSSMIKTCEVENTFIKPLSEYSRQAREDLTNGESIDIQDLLELDLLNVNLDRAREGIAQLQ